MRPKILVGVLLCAANISLRTHSQALAADTEKILKESLVGKSLVLANLSAAPEVKGIWDGQKPRLELPPWHALAALNINSVHVAGPIVTIKGMRRQITRDKSGKLVMGTYETPVTLTIRLAGDPATIVPTLRDAFFFRDFETAVEHVPKEFQNSISTDAPKSKKNSRDTSPSNCDCNDLSATCSPLKVTGAEPPKVLSSADPQFSNEARANHISGSVLVGVRLSESGEIKDEWILRDVGYGLDPQAAFAVRKYKLAPATCYGKPIPVDFEVEVNFSVF